MCRRQIHWTPCFAVLILILSSTASAELVGRWQFDETSGAVAADSSGNGNDATVLNGGTWIDGRHGGALQLDGTDDYVELPIGSIIATLEECTFAIWVNFGGGGNWSRIIDIGTSQANYIYLCAADGDGALRVAIVAGNNTWNEIIYSGGLPVEEWHHVAVTVSDSTATMLLYLDGEEVGSYTGLTNSVDDLGETDNNWLGHSQYAPADTDLNGALDDFQIYNEVLSQAGIQRAMQGFTPTSSQPQPGDGATDVRRDAVLGWAPGQTATAHDVYFGTDFDNVNDASTTDPKGVLASENQADGTYDPPGLMELGQTYYWRIDDINVSAATISKGAVWTFTTEPYAYLVTDVNATASIPAKVGAELENIINGSGLTEEGGHSAEGEEMWQGEGEGDIPVSIEFTLDRVYKLDEVRIWNYNHEYEFIMDFGLKDVTIEYSTDANEWMVLGNYVLPQGIGLATFPAEVIDFGGAPAKYVRLIKNSHYGGRGFGLSEVQFYYLPTFAREPDPEAGTVNVDPDVTLSWRPGREAVSHEVHVSTDSNAVAAGEALADTVSVPSYDTAGLNLLLSEKYYWMVNEVNEAEATPSWSSAVWDFNTPDFIAVDDFDSYTDEDGSRVYQAWLDGYDDSSNGSIVGNDDPPYADQDNIHSGAQSMPFTFGVEGATTSEAELSLGGIDWTRADAQTLVVWFRGSLGNGTPQLYLKVNDTRVDYDGSAGSLAGQVWKQWNVDLASLGAAASNARTLVLGVSGTGAGMMCFDDIRLYRTAPPATGDAVDPGTANLAAYYPMSDNANDASGHSLDGTVEVGSSFETGPTGYGRAVVFDGTSGYVDLPIGSLIQSLDSITIATWVNDTGAGSWARIFDFGAGTTVYTFLTPNSNVGTMRFGITTGAGAGESMVEAPSALPSGWHHVAVTIDAETGTMNLYLDGSVVDSGTTETLPSDLGETTQNWIGRSQYADDPYLTGAVDEFRLYDRALSAPEVQYLVGDR